MKPVFFSTPADWRAWLSKNHKETEEIWLGFVRKGSKKTSLTIREAVDEALCFGWIDGLLKKTGVDSFKLRFTPRRKSSLWSEVNTKRAKELIKLSRMRPAGLKAFQGRDKEKTNFYSYERRSQGFSSDLAKVFKKNKGAWEFFNAQSPGYQRTMSFWVSSAKKDETRSKRLARVVKVSAQGKRVDLLSPFKDK